jgi:hypothetical protein
MEQVILKSNKKFGDRFDFTNTFYKDFTRTKLSIRCKRHNEHIDIIPRDHLRQVFGGCKQCQKEKPEIILQDNETIRDVNMEIYRDLYQVTNFGRVFSKKTNKELDMQLSSGYNRVSLHTPIKVKSKSKRVHRLVYLTFGGEIEKGKVIDHIDGNKLNNRIENLRCVAETVNMQNAHKNNKNMHKNQVIQAFDKEGNFVKEFNSTKEGADFIKQKYVVGINNCLRGDQHTSGGFVWKFKDPSILKEKEERYIKITTDFVCLGTLKGVDYSNYFINREGIVANKNTNRKIKPDIDPNNYSTTGLCNSEKDNHFFLHRLLGKFFLENGEIYFPDEKKYVVNHKDKNRNNNSLDNLEWMTKYQNDIHGSGKRVAKIDKLTDKVIKEYDSIAEAFRELGVTSKVQSSCISVVCKGKRKIAFGFKWKYLNYM